MKTKAEKFEQIRHRDRDSERRKHEDRKTRVDYVHAQAVRLSGCEASAAWNRLVIELQAMTEPEARMPRFNPLLNAIWRAATNES